jgi:hypothetical protein
MQDECGGQILVGFVNICCHSVASKVSDSEEPRWTLGPTAYKKDGDLARNGL